MKYGTIQRIKATLNYYIDKYKLGEISGHQTAVLQSPILEDHELKPGENVSRAETQQPAQLFISYLKGWGAQLKAPGVIEYSPCCGKA